MQREWFIGSTLGRFVLGAIALAYVLLFLVARGGLHWSLLFPLATFVLLACSHLSVHRRDDRIVLAYFPFWRRSIVLQDIVEAKAGTYRPLRTFGGWGIRMRGGAVAYAIAGNQAVTLQLRSGHSVLIGSRDPERLRRDLALAERP